MKYLFIIVVTMTMLMCGDVSAAQKKVLIIHSYHRDLPWIEQCNRGISSILTPTFLLEYVYLDTKRIPKSQFQDKAEAAMSVFRRFNPDVVMTGDDNALRLLGPRIAATGTPVVFFGINNNPRSYFSTIPDNVTGVLERVPLFPWIRHLATILPHATKALVLMDNSPTAEAIIEVTFADRKKAFVDGISVEYAVAANWTEWQRIISELNSYDFITMPIFHALKSTSGIHIPVEEAIRWTSQNSPVPVFAYQDYAVNDTGVVGSYVIFGEAHGRLAARIAKDILEGENPVLPPTYMDQEGRFYFNKKQLERFGLSLPDSIRQKTIYQ